mmetsp:Transcript_2045/g.4823  ORF Transcript_2045/g.4823 Transcript_2045/m.4823 type:complete len:225 (-) Transcript_2045:647-1321(-)
MQIGRAHGGQTANPARIAATAGTGVSGRHTSPAQAHAGSGGRLLWELCSRLELHPAVFSPGIATNPDIPPIDLWFDTIRSRKSHAGDLCFVSCQEATRSGSQGTNLHTFIVQGGQSLHGSDFVDHRRRCHDDRHGRSDTPANQDSKSGNSQAGDYDRFDPSRHGSDRCGSQNIAKQQHCRRMDDGAGSILDGISFQISECNSGDCAVLRFSGDSANDGVDAAID